MKSALRYSVLDGAAYYAMYGFGEYYFAAYALLLNATDFQLGILATFPILIASIMQLFSINLMHKFKSRKKSVLALVFLQGLMILPIILIYHIESYRLTLLTLLVTLYSIFGWLSNPIWVSWIGDLVPEKIRGKFFSNRQLVASSTMFVSFIIAGFILTYAKDNFVNEYAGFAVIFIIAVIARLISVYFLSKQYEPKLKIKKQDNFSFKQFLKEFKKRYKLGYFNVIIAYLSFMYFGLYITSPYIIAYLFKDLHFSYLQYVLFTATSLLFELAFLPIWGSFIDKYGPLKILKLTGYLLPIVPVLLAFSKSLPILILTQVVGGFLWAGFTVSSINFMLETTTKEKRVAAFAYYNFISGVFIFIGSLIGAYIIKLALELNLSSISSIFWSKYIIILLLGALMRLIAALIFLPKLKDIKVREEISSKDLLIKVVSSFPHRYFHRPINLHTKK